MTVQRNSVQRVSETRPAPFGARAQTFDARLGHPDLIQFVNEMAAAPPDAVPNRAPAPESAPPRPHGGRSA